VSVDEKVRYQVLEAGGQRMAVLPEAVLLELSLQAGRGCEPRQAEHAAPAAPLAMDVERLARRLRKRRMAAGLTQVELARRAGVRAETVNRIERGHTNPDFATIRKLVVAMDAAEQVAATSDA
jgi:DNA-binding XRE family transcriptional regulator